MAKNEDGEFELILGNRQLLSVFFIVVVLLGVFFTMGYIVGSRSAPLVAEVATNRPAPAAPKSDSGTTAAPAAEANPPDAEPEKPAAPVANPPEPTRTAAQQSAPAAEAPKAEPVKSEPAKPEVAKKEPPRKEEPKREETKKESAKKEAAKKEAPAKASGEPAPGTYLQIAATTKKEADVLVDVLRQKNFHALTAEVPEKAGMFRVLVGPIAESAVNKTKTDLQSAGLPGNVAMTRKY